MLSCCDWMVLGGGALALSIAGVFYLVPMLWRLVGGKSHPENAHVTSDIPGNPHCFDFSMISLLRTMPEPNNFNIVWTKVPLDQPFIVRGQLPPGRFSSYSVYPGVGSVPESMELHANKDPAQRLFEVTVTRPSEQHPSTTGDVLVVGDSNAPVGMLVMRNYLVPPGTLVRTPEVVRKSDGKILRPSEHIVAGQASVHLQPLPRDRAIFTIVKMHAMAWIVLFLWKGWTTCTLHSCMHMSALAAGLTILLYQALYWVGKKRMHKLIKDLEVDGRPNTLRLCDLEKSSKGSQPSKIHKYYFMHYAIPPGFELAVRGQIDKTRQEYWSLVLYDVYGLPLPQFYYDLNASLNPVSDNVYKYDIRLTNGKHMGLVPRKGLSELDVSSAQEGYALFRLVHPRDEEVTAFSQPVCELVPVAMQEGKSKAE